MVTQFPELFLHYIWKLQLFENLNLKTTQKHKLQIVKPGIHNHHAGPDFQHAHININSTLWAGSVEIHKKSSDWLVHGHQKDKAYNNTILHVVFEHDKEIYRSSGEPIPTLELKNRIPSKYLQRYWLLLNSQNWIPCSKQLEEGIDSYTINWHLWIDALVVQRLERKINAIERELLISQNNWEETFYWFLARNFGVKQNADAFESLAKSLSLKILGKHKNNLLQLEALLFGQAGFLDEPLDNDYSNNLRKEYLFLKQKYSLIPLQKAAWKFGRMRPPNFPTIRLAQFAKLVFQSNLLFSKILEFDTTKSLYELFDLQLSGFWNYYYKLDGKRTSKRVKSLGKHTINLILINTIVPFLFAYGRFRGGPTYEERAIALLDALPPEQNSIIDNWKDLGFSPMSAYETQGLLELKKEYCKNKQCLNCQVGHQILKTDKK